MAPTGRPSTRSWTARRLEPIKIVSTRGNTVDGDYHPEPRVASIVASMTKQVGGQSRKPVRSCWSTTSDIKNLKTTTIESAKFPLTTVAGTPSPLLPVAANASNKVAAVDTKTGKLAALVDTAKIPHPGRGANFVHPKFGPVWTTGHLGRRAWFR